MGLLFKSDLYWRGCCVYGEKLYRIFRLGLAPLPPRCHCVAEDGARVELQRLRRLVRKIASKNILYVLCYDSFPLQCSFARLKIFSCMILFCCYVVLQFCDVIDVVLLLKCTKMAVVVSMSQL